MTLATRIILYLFTYSLSVEGRENEDADIVQVYSCFHLFYQGSHGTLDPPQK